MKILLVSALALLAVSCSSDKSKKSEGSSELNGAYYTPIEEYADGEFTPETLQVFKNGVATSYSVHNGAAIVVQGTYTIKGNKVISPATGDPDAVVNFDCAGVLVEQEGLGEAFEVEFKKTKNGIELDVFKGNWATLNFASDEKVKEITSLPHCKRIEK